MTLLSLLEWTGTGLGLIGSGLLAMNTRRSGWGFVAFLASNTCWMGFGILTSAWGLVTMQVGFTLTSAWGVYRWLVVARRRSTGGFLECERSLPRPFTRVQPRHGNVHHEAGAVTGAPHRSTEKQPGKAG